MRHASFLSRERIVDLLHECIGLATYGSAKSSVDRIPSGSPSPVDVARVAIGHGRSPLWRELKDFLRERCGLAIDEYNRVPTAGYSRQARLGEMLAAASMAFLVMTAEDEQPDGKRRARENVVHEVGLFQGRLGFKRAIVLIEEGCEQFSNIDGLDQIRFPKGTIGACFEDARRILEREGMIPNPDRREVPLER